MKWQDTSPKWQAQDLASLRRILANRNLRSDDIGATLQPATGALFDRSSMKLLVESSALQAIQAHLGQTMHEQGGLLIGEVFGGRQAALAEATTASITAASTEDAASVLVILIQEAIASVEFDASAISLRMQSSIWNEARARLEAQRLIVGWYHSHPDLGAFFSGTDRRTQAAFFPHPYSLGWVIDPIRREQAFYLGASATEISASQVGVLAE